MTNDQGAQGRKAMAEEPATDIGEARAGGEDCLVPGHGDTTANHAPNSSGILPYGRHRRDRPAPFVVLSVPLGEGYRDAPPAAKA